MTEEWRITSEIDGIGEVSATGLFKNYNWCRTGKEKITRGNNTSDGHLCISFNVDGVPKTYLVHRLVAKAFNPIPERYKGIPVDELVVHHKDFNPLNNHRDNLEWMTLAEHIRLHHSTPVFQYGIDGKFIRGWETMTEAEKTLGLSHIWDSCAGVRAISGDCQWRYVKYDSIPPIKSRGERIAEKLSKKVVQLTKEKEFIAIHQSANAAARSINSRHGEPHITECCNGKRRSAYGSFWMWYDEYMKESQAS